LPKEAQKKKGKWQEKIWKARRGVSITLVSPGEDNGRKTKKKKRGKGGPQESSCLNIRRKIGTVVTYQAIPREKNLVHGQGKTIRGKTKNRKGDCVYPKGRENPLEPPKRGKGG